MLRCHGYRGGYACASSASGARGASRALRIAGGVIAKYPDGNPAITQIWSGHGFVILSGVHPTADQATLSAVGQSSTDGIHQDTAWSLINAALHDQPLQAF